MRLFPATARQRLAASGAAAALVLGTTTLPLAHADPHHKKKHLQHQQAQAHHAVHRAQADLDESSARTRQAFRLLSRSREELTQARDDLAVAHAHVKVARARYQRQRQALVEARSRLREAEAELVTGQQAVTDQHTKLVNTVTSMYEEGDPQLVGFLSLLNSQTPADLTRRNEANNVVLGSQDQALDSLKAAEVMLEVHKTQTEDARAEVAQRKERAQANLVLKQQYQADAVDARNRVRHSVKLRKDGWAMARAARAHDRAKLARSKRQEAKAHRELMAEIRREKRRAAQLAAQQAAQHAAQNQQAQGYAGPTSGLLLHPVNGPLTSPYGWRVHPIYHYWGLHDGDDFGAPCGAPLFAVADGTVLSEYYSSVWGNRLYLNLGLINGKNVTVIYNHLSAYRSSVGESVSKGQVVGLVGTTGWSTGCHTHFTVMVDGQAVDPAPWFG